jgi:uncharacterized integral membrane protein
MAHNIRLYLGLFLAGIAVIFIIQNVAVIEIRFLFWTLSMSRALMMFILVAIGMVIGWILHSMNAAGKKHTGNDSP